MNAKAPASVVVGGQKFRVSVAEMEEWGRMDFDARRITLSPRAMQTPATVRSTLQHEMLHAALCVSGVSFADAFDEESVVRAIENIFFPAWEKVQKQLNNRCKEQPMPVRRRSSKGSSPR